MEALSGLVKVSLAEYLRNLPLPDSFGGWFSLSGRDWLNLLPFVGAVGGMGYLLYKQVTPRHVVNLSIKKGEAKVVNTCDIEDITGEKAVYCRCWKSKKFPLCDGSHNKHNEVTGDNVGPLIVKKAQK